MDTDRFIVEYLRNPSRSETKTKTKGDIKLKKHFTYVPGSKELCIIFPYWHGKLSRMLFLRGHLARQGKSSIEYTYPSKVLSADYTATLSYFTQIQQAILADLEHIRSTYNFKNLHFVSFSLGECPALMVADKVKGKKKLSAYVPSHCLADSLWQGVRTQRIRRKMEKQGLTLSALRKHWKPLAPTSNISSFKDVSVKVVLSQKDSVIPYAHGREFVKHLKKKKAKVSVEERKYLGHYLTLARELFFPRDI